ncbi:unnamed protein product [Ilex paraguariensis]|uniref:Uncharacterized protein n=1 Tax=Ilex paraguariensis TaxID=185542 RepID=A0ABC8UJ68_9AQUA
MGAPNKQDDLCNLALYFMDNILLEASILEIVSNNSTVNDIEHLLHLVHHSMCISSAGVASGSDTNGKENEWKFINSITKLQEFGVELKATGESRSLFDGNSRTENY